MAINCILMFISRLKPQFKHNKKKKIENLLPYLWINLSNDCFYIYKTTPAFVFATGLPAKVLMLDKLC